MFTYNFGCLAILCKRKKKTAIFVSSGVHNGITDDEPAQHICYIKLEVNSCHSQTQTWQINLAKNIVYKLCVWLLDNSKWH